MEALSQKEKQRARLISLLKELFQLDQPDLDFGFYKIMHAKAGQVSDFLEKDLLTIIKDSFGEADEAQVAEARAAYEAARKQATDFGAPDPEVTEPVKKAKATYEAAKDSGSNEGDVYDHLYRFFERYYDDGDFMSRRYFARETDGKAAPYAVPYDGREVYLHWANRDQYYIKTSDYLTNFTFDLLKSDDLAEGVKKQAGVESLPVHCRIVDASEGEHNNVKASEETERFFVLHDENPVVVSDDGLILQFEYKPLPGKKYPLDADREKELKTNYGASKKGDLPILDLADKILAAIPEDGEAFKINLQTIVETDKIKKRPLLAKYLNKYTARNTMDYFIHKDLGGFLRRELDFYIKNEVMRLDDLEDADAARVETYLAKVKVLRKIARHLIEFLAQLEEFQKKIWLKKKFVVETNYCITLDRIPEAFYEEIATNEAQREEWVKLFSIDEIEADLSGPGYSTPLTVDFLKANDKLLVDTAFYDVLFKERLLAELENLDEATNGTLIHSDNFHGISLAVSKFNSCVKCIYIDPPYNSSASEIIYKNNYKHSSWLSLMASRLEVSRPLMSADGVIEVAIDDIEFHRLEGLCHQVFGQENHVGNLAIMHNPKGRDKSFLAASHEYTILHAKDIRSVKINRLKLSEEAVKGKYPKNDAIGLYRELPLRRRGSSPFREDRPYMYFPFLHDRVTGEISVLPRDEYTKIYDGQSFDDDFVNTLENKYDESDRDFILPIREDGSRGRWRWGYDTSEKACNEDRFFLRGNPKTIYAKDYANDTYLPKSLWFDNRYDASTKGTNLLKNIIPKNDFDYPKSIFAVQDLVYMGSEEDSLICDFFAGSGTTSHAVLNLNRSGNSNRNYLLMEMGIHFDSVVLPRTKKVSYSSEWKSGKPVGRDGISQVIKYIRLESYEDALNNLAFKEEVPATGSDDFRRDYMLNYWLEFETQGSPSLLNVEAFADPTAYTLKVKKPGSDEYVSKNVDLVETFNWLIGLHVEHLDRWRGYNADTKREEDPELPEDSTTRLALDGRMVESDEGVWQFRKVEGYTLPTPGDKSIREKTLVIWRKLTGDIEADNLVLDEWFKKYRLSTHDTEFDVIYVNGSNNLPNLRQAEETWKVRLIEEHFHTRMWDMED